MPKCKYNGTQVQRMTLNGNDLVLVPGEEFDLEMTKSNSHIDKMISKGLIELPSGVKTYVKEAPKKQTPPPPPPPTN